MTHLKRLTLLCLVLCLCLSLAACSGNQDSTTDPGPGEDTLYTVTVKTSAGKVPYGVQYYVYKTADVNGGIAAFGTFEDSNEITFTAPKSDTYTLVLEGVAEGYDVKDSYTLSTPNTEVVLTSAPIQGQEATGKVYRLGDIIRDFSITDSDGNTHMISELLKTKKAVVLNFWYVDCPFCIKEFPYLQSAYEAYRDDLEVIAMNPVENNQEIAAFRQDKDWTFPMANCEMEWVQAMGLDKSGFPRTVIIDRYGMICVMDGTVEEEGIFDAIFAHFTADDYVQTEIRDMEDFCEKNSDK